MRQRLRIKDISALSMSDVLGLDGKIRSCYMSQDGLVFHLDDLLRSELHRYLLKRFNVSGSSLRPLLRAHLMLPLFPTQKRDRFSNNTLAQHFCSLDKSIKLRFESKTDIQSSSWLQRIAKPLAASLSAAG